jgi:hypothetical protein
LLLGLEHLEPLEESRAGLAGSNGIDDIVDDTSIYLEG